MISLNHKADPKDKLRWIKFEMNQTISDRYEKLIQLFKLNALELGENNVFFQQYTFEEKIVFRLFIKTTYRIYKESLKSTLIALTDKYYSKEEQKSLDLLDIDEFAIVGFQGKNERLIQPLVCKACEIVQKISDDFSELEIDVAIQNIIPFNIAFLSAFNYSREELANYFDWYFYQKLEALELVEGRQEFMDSLVEELHKNFSAQVDSIGPFIDIILNQLENEQDDIEIEWLDDWYETCVIAYETVSKDKSKLIIDYHFKTNSKYRVKESRQKYWQVIQYVMDTSQSMFGIPYIYELNVLYTLKQYLSTQD